MKRYIIRLDDASEYMDLKKWKQMEMLLDKYRVKPIFGIIPENKDTFLISKYEKNNQFWTLAESWIDKGWIPAMHGFEHRYVTKTGGMNPVNMASEFAGLTYEEQATKIHKGWKILIEHSIIPEIFFAPSHTFDEKTLAAIHHETPIRIISDTIAWDIYKKGDFFFIPQQSGIVRNLPFKTVTFCYHPNVMEDEDYIRLEKFLQNNRKYFENFQINKIKDRKLNIFDIIIRKLYFAIKYR